jgi:hypothetical protein
MKGKLYAELSSAFFTSSIMLFLASYILFACLMALSFMRLTVTITTLIPYSQYYIYAYKTGIVAAIFIIIGFLLALTVEDINLITLPEMLFVYIGSIFTLIEIGCLILIGVLGLSLVIADTGSYLFFTTVVNPYVWKIAAYFIFIISMILILPTAVFYLPLENEIYSEIHGIWDKIWYLNNNKNKSGLVNKNVQN